MNTTKESLYKTARIRADIPADHMLPLGLARGQFVGIRLFGRVFNALTGKREAVYAVSSSQTFAIGQPLMFSSALDSFCL